MDPTQNLIDKCNLVLAYLDGWISLHQFRTMLGLPPPQGLDSLIFEVHCN